jgi:phosphatidylinositol N-acetylglucosaminyltransferase subunit Q
MEWYVSYFYYTLSYIELNLVVLLRLSPFLSTIIFSIGVVSHFGITIAISYFSDLLGLFTIHISLFYFFALIIYHCLLRTVQSLWHLFCGMCFFILDSSNITLFKGKRINVLRNRIDSWNYDVDQLLFGTILFTLIAYLFPTVLTYYALFSMVRLLYIAH